MYCAYGKQALIKCVLKINFIFWLRHNFVLASFLTFIGFTGCVRFRFVSAAVRFDNVLETPNRPKFHRLAMVAVFSKVTMLTRCTSLERI
jgi:hypothetical protein